LVTDRFRRVRTRLAAAISITAMLAIAAGAETLPDQVVVVEKLHAALLGMMKNAEELGYEGRFEKVSGVLPDTFDLEFMASKVVGRRWKKLDEAQQKRWVDTFGRLTAANYAGRFNQYSDESFETLGKEAAAHDTVLVLTKIHIPDREDVQLNYRLLETPKGWRIIDIYLNGTVSEVAMRRSDYGSVLKNDGFEKLCSVVDERIAKLEAGEVSGSN